MHFYETYEHTFSDDPAPDGIDYKGSCTAVAHETLENAIKYADSHGLVLIAEIGGSWDEYEKCEICGEWYPGDQMTKCGICTRCERAGIDHGF